MADGDESTSHGVRKLKTRVRRSRTGCAECRSRKIKCDETRPKCRHCVKAGKSCSITDSIFKPHALSSETNAEHGESVDSTRDAHSSAAFSHGLTQDSHIQHGDDDGRASNHVDFAFHAPTTCSSERNTPRTRQFQSLPGPLRATSCENLARAHDTNLISPRDGVQHDHHDESSLQPQIVSDPRLHAGSILSHIRPFNADTNSPGVTIDMDRPSRLRTPSTTLPDASLDHYEEAFFLRYFSEHIAPWLDLVNFQRYFGHECITLLRDNSLLRFATCALAAKQLSQSPEPTAAAFRGTSKAQTAIARILLQRNSNFLWYGAKYYDKAITTLARQLAPHASQTQCSPRDIGSETSLPYMLTRADGEDPIVRLLATCLLIQFENLSGNSRGWTGHLDGFSRLLALLDGGHLSDTSPLPQRMFGASSQRALRAAFWWFVINDMEESFVNRRKMRTSLNNAPLWRRMGLHMDDADQPLDLDTSETPDAPPHLQEDLLSFVLMRIVCRLVNMLALAENMANEHMINTPQGNANADSLDAIQSDLDNWMLSTTASFQPVSTWRSLEMGSVASSEVLGTEMWYSHSLRAVTVLYYHMACMLLLIHQPTLLRPPANQGQPFDLLRAMDELRLKLRSHAGQIVAIATGMVADSAVRVRTVQPLYIAGRSLTERNDRKTVVEMLRSIQDDLGLVCEYRVNDLMQEWSVSYESLGLLPRTTEASHLDIS